MTDSLDIPHQDAEAVKAVLAGASDRYEEIVRRHERQVYAVAWSRLGNAALAEEAAQQAFIRGYTHLSQLKDQAKVGSWIGAMARNIAINLSLMHRREMDKRERWFLQQAATTRDEGEEPKEVCTPKILQEALAELSASQRECLVLFYLEGKSNREAAAALGISEATFRVKLHRARESLRRELDERLAESLCELRPKNSLSSVVMAGIFIAAPSTSIGGAAAGSGYTVSKMTMGSTWMSAKILVSLGWILPIALIHWWIERREAANFIEQQGFRAKLYRLEMPSFLAITCVAAFAFWLAESIDGYLESTENKKGLTIDSIFSGSMPNELQPLWYLLAFLSTISAIFLFRLYRNGPNRFWAMLFLGAGAMAVVAILTAMGWLPFIFTLILLFAIPLMETYALRYRPFKMDYNLFLRSSQGMLTPSSSHAGESQAMKITDSDLARFSRFLGSRFLTIEQSRKPDGLRLSLIPVRRRLFRGFFRWILFIKESYSYVIIHSGGNVTAVCSEDDAYDIAALTQNKVPEIEVWESNVKNALQTSLRLFRDRKAALAEQVLGEATESVILIKPVSEAPVARWYWILSLFDFALFLLFLAAGGLLLLLRWYLQR